MKVLLDKNEGIAIKLPLTCGGTVVKRAEVARYWGAIAETWTRHAHAGYDIYRVGLNTPAFLETLPPVRGLSGLDIGCGEGPHARAFTVWSAGAWDRCRADLHPACA